MAKNEELIVLKKGEEFTEIYAKHKDKYIKDGYTVPSKEEAEKYKKYLTDSQDADRATEVIKQDKASDIIEDQRMTFLSPSEIKLDEEHRQRTDFGKPEEWKEFVEDIRMNRLIHPICVREDFTLIAGGRRLKAVRELGWDKVPVNILIGEIDEFRLAVIELAENIRRKGLNYAERVEAVRKIDRLQKERYGAKTSGRGTGWSARDTAKMIGKSVGQVSEDIKLAEAIEKMPELGKLENKAQAKKKIQILEERLLREELAKRLSEEGATTPLSKQHKIIADSYLVLPPPNGLITKDNWKECGFMAGAKKLQANTFDFIDLDWPWDVDIGETSMEKNSTKEDLKRLYKDIGCLPDGLEYPEFAEQVLSECYRVLKPTGWIVVWYAQDPWHDTTVDIMRRIGFLVRGIPAIWNKNEGQSKVPEVNLGHGYEAFLYARKSKSATLVKRGELDIFTYKRVAPSKRVHRAEKPIDLMCHIGSTFSEQGSKWCVPFAGSNNTALAAADHSSSCISFDIYQEHKDAFITKVYEAKPGGYAKWHRG